MVLLCELCALCERYYSFNIFCLSPACPGNSTGLRSSSQISQSKNYYYFPAKPEQRLLYFSAYSVDSARYIIFLSFFFSAKPEQRSMFFSVVSAYSVRDKFLSILIYPSPREIILEAGRGRWCPPLPGFPLPCGPYGLPRSFCFETGRFRCLLFWWS